MEYNDYKSRLAVVYSCRYHVVWCPKYRRKVIEGDIETRLKELVAQVCSEVNAELFEIETMPDRVRLIVGIDPQFGIHRTVKLIKGKTSHHLRREFKTLTTRLPTLWTNSYFVSTEAEVPALAIKQYVESQKTVQ